MRRLYIQIYGAFIVLILCCVVVAGVASWLLAGERGRVPPFLRAAINEMAQSIPFDAPPQELRASLVARSEQMHVHLALRDARGTLLASSGFPLPHPKGLHQHEGVWFHFKGRGGMHLKLDNGYLLSALTRTPRGHPLRFLGILALLAGAIAIGCYPIARRITRRLERLQDAMDRWSKDDLGTRMALEGKDEVTRLASHFNEAAARVEKLVQQQKRILASASHELRSPLTRLRMALELLGGDKSKRGAQENKLLEDAVADVQELDSLIGDVLIAARLENRPLEFRTESLDLLRIAREEAALVEAKVVGESLALWGNPSLLRRMLRNLLENAQRHAEGSGIEVHLFSEEEKATIQVQDRGPGVPPGDERRIFEPFYRPQGHREGKHGGVGLGLSLVRQIARQHGGDVRYQPREGGGSVFVVTLMLGKQAS